MSKSFVAKFVFITLCLFPKTTLADDNQLEKRLEILEAKMERMAAIEAENKELKVRLQKTEAKLERVTAQKVATVAPVGTLERPAAPVSVATPAIANEAPVTPVSTESNWSGVYAGMSAGYGKNNAPINRQTITPGSFIYDNNTTYGEGPLAGGQIGLNYQFSSNLVLGLETDFDWANVVLTNYTSNGDFSGGNNFGINTNSYNSRYGLDWLGTARARFGYSFANLMPYITGGLAYGQMSSYENRWSNNALGWSFTPSTSSSFQSGNASKVNVGWVTGAGAEYLLSNNVSVKAEYLYAYLGNLTRYDQSFGTNCNPCFYFPSVSINSFGVHQARVGLNYHTDWLKNFTVNTEQR